MTSPMRRTTYGYVCATEELIERKLDKELKKHRIKKHDVFGQHKGKKHVKSKR